ncbi:MAG TPA: hypothetical protein ENI96_10000 [Sedimenticola thiotaurini]|uniref:Uncharacterized protein n=1 Tax=Sedimenticola thiotaurini TaxID=1543721 RepID=A0A831RPE5_9GAMM|nr:hypothetical protein [Sedimenticola thiotaurini]
MASPLSDLLYQGEVEAIQNTDDIRALEQARNTLRDRLIGDDVAPSKRDAAVQALAAYSERILELGGESTEHPMPAAAIDSSHSADYDRQAQERRQETAERLARQWSDKPVNATPDPEETP